MTECNAQPIQFARARGCRVVADFKGGRLTTDAGVLLHQLRSAHLAETELATAQINTIRLTLLKIAARMTLSVRRVVLHLSSSYPYQSLFRTVASTLIPAPG